MPLSGFLFRLYNALPQISLRVLIHIKSEVFLVSYIFNAPNQESFPFLSKTKLLKTKNKKHIFFLTAQKELTGFDHNFLTFETSYERTDEYDGRISQVVKDVKEKIIKKNVTVINMIRIYLFLKVYQAD